MTAIFSRVRHPSHPGRGHGSLTCHMTQLERSDWLMSENFTNIMIELVSHRRQLFSQFTLGLICFAQPLRMYLCPVTDALVHYSDVIKGPMAYQITSVSSVHSTVFFSGADQRNHQIRVTGLCEGNSPVPVEFPSQRANNEENVSIWWRHHVLRTGHVTNTIFSTFHSGYTITFSLP